MNGSLIDLVRSATQIWPSETNSDNPAYLSHNLFLMTFDNKLGTAPPNAADSGVRRVLDIGTGTGIWAIDFGDEHPEAEVSLTAMV